MDVLFLAPQPLYEDRGSPIAVHLFLKVLSERGDQIDVVTYHVGKSVEYNNITIHRTANVPFIHTIQAGFSWKKLLCDFLMLFKIVPLILRKRYQLVHAVEEAVFFALLLKIFFKIPYVYDMDSSLSQQMVEQLPWLAPFSPIFSYFEGLAVKNAQVVVPVCDALALDIAKHRPKKVVLLYDVSLLPGIEPQEHRALKTELLLDGLVGTYVGNLQSYQGIDLLLESFALVLDQTQAADLVIVGGSDEDIEKYQAKSRDLNISHKVHFLGPKPVDELGIYLSSADILLSPRIIGKNTPMKIYSYLHSGKAVLATNILSHTQVLNQEVAMLADPSPKDYAQALVRLLKDENLRLKLGRAGKELVEEKYTYSAFRGKVNKLLDGLKVEIAQDKGVTIGEEIYSLE